MIDQGNYNKNVYDNDMNFGYGMNNGMFPMIDSVQPTTALKAESGLTYSIPILRKRSRETSSFDPFPMNAQFVDQNQKPSLTFLGHDFSMQIYQQQVEIDRFIANHTEKVRTEIEASRRRNSMRLIAAAEEGINKRLRSKEEEIMKIGKLNYALEEKVKSLNVENQIWQQMAQTNEATANALRRNLQQILTQIQRQNQNGWTTDKSTADDVHSCCGSNEIDGNNNEIDYGRIRNDKNGRRYCRNCGKVESCVLLLPCRHLCICSACESSINVCPVCKSIKNATVHVNIT